MLMTQKLLQKNKENIFEARYRKSVLELRAILEITQSINENASEKELYMMYGFILRGNLKVEKIALYTKNDEEDGNQSLWACKVNFGTEDDFRNITIEPELQHIHQEIEQQDNSTEIRFTKDFKFQNKAFQKLSVLIPIFHKDKELAYLFLNKNIEENEDLEVSLRFMQALSNIIIVAIENKKLVRKQVKQEALKKELEIAKQVQNLLFPKKLPKSKRLNIHTTYQPHASVGGDYFDFIPLTEDKFILCIADVSGKGIPAAILMSNFQASLRTLVRQTMNLPKIIEGLNYQIYENSQGDNFITIFLCMYDMKTKTLQYINAGHNPAILLEENKEDVHLLDKGCTLLGVFEPLPFINQSTIPNIDNFKLFAYTDGVNEANNAAGQEYGHETLIDFIQKHKKLSLEEIHQKLMQNISQFRGETALRDDLTLISCRVA